MFLSIPSLVAGRQGSETSDWDAQYIVSGSNFTTSNRALINITGLSAPVVASSLYEIEAFLRVQATDPNGVLMGINFDAAGATVAWVAEEVDTASTVAITGNTSFSSQGGAFCELNNTNTCVFLKTIVVTGANAGYITIQTYKATAGSVTIYIGSILKIKKLA